MQISSLRFIGILFAFAKPVEKFLTQVYLYLKFLKLVLTISKVNLLALNMAIAAFSLQTRSISSHKKCHGKTLSHFDSVMPYGGSTNTISTLLSGSFFKRLMQSSL